jgi:VanZ family protein
MQMGLYAGSVAAAVLLFVGGPDYYSPRAWRLAWDLGHLLAFFLWTAAGLSASARLAAHRTSTQILIVAPIALFLGLGIECAQSLLGRTFSLADIANDLLGSASAIAFLSSRRREMRRVALRSAEVIVLTLVALQSLPLARVVIDDGIAWKQFPVLSDFETPFELTRWTSRSLISIDHRIARQGSASLQVPLTTEPYSGASLQNFPSGWEGYAALHLSIYNESEDPLGISISIHDEKHMQTGRAYPDRFTAHYALQHGWNDIDIPLERVRNAPAHRTLDLESVRDLSVVAIALPTPRVIHIDDVRLTR